MEYLLAISCLLDLCSQGRPNEIVWVSFVKYHAAGSEPAGFDQQKDCSSQLTIWDGAAPDADLDRKVSRLTFSVDFIYKLTKLLSFRCMF